MKEDTFQFFYRKEVFFIKSKAFYFIEYQDKRMVNLKKTHIPRKFSYESFVSFKKVPTFASAIEKQTQIRESKTQKCNNRMARSSIG